MRLQLQRPLVFFDLETTGIEVQQDRIVEICVIKVMPDGERLSRSRRINPEMPIPPEATAIHGITDQDVADQPTFRQVARSLYDFLADCDLAGYNIIRFDVPLLVEEFKRVDMDFSVENRNLVDACVIFHRKESRDLAAALRFYCNEEHVDAHGAESDVLATIKVLEGQLERYDDLPADAAALAEFCNQRKSDWVDRDGKLRWRNGEVVLAFGRQKGTSLRELAENNSGYLSWIVGSNFSTEIKQIVAAALEGNFPTPPG